MIRATLIFILSIGVITGILGVGAGFQKADGILVFLSFVYLVVSAYCLQLVIRSK